MRCIVVANFTLVKLDNGKLKKIKMSYPPVYYEIESMIKSGLVTCELIGRMKIISLPESSVRFLKAVPF
jgi:hypothetical protein